MFRTVWLAFICLSSLGVLLALRASVESRSTPKATAGVEVPSKPDTASQKADQQGSAHLEDSEATLTTSTVKIIPSEPDPAVGPKASDVIASPTDTDEITRWHWHEGSKIIKRTTAAGRASLNARNPGRRGVPELTRQPSINRNSQAKLLRSDVALDSQAQPHD